MPADAALPTSSAAAPVLVRRMVARHSATVRVTHWINVISLTLMLMSGLQIFNAHAALYWGQKATFAEPWLSMTAKALPDGLHGFTKVGPWTVDTTGLFGASKVHGAMQARGFPAWATIPTQGWLAVARRWHFFWAWIFALNGLVYVASAFIGGHFKRDLAPTLADLKDIPRDILDHIRLRFAHGWEATRYGVLQKLAYVGAAFVVLPLIVLTGMTMSPGLNAAFPFLLDVFGGRQSARTIHFLCAAAIVVFVVVHLAMVVLTGPINQVRAMITGRYAIKVPPGEEAQP